MGLGIDNSRPVRRDSARSGRRHPCAGRSLALISSRLPPSPRRASCSPVPRRRPHPPGTHRRPSPRSGPRSPRTPAWPSRPRGCSAPRTGCCTWPGRADDTGSFSVNYSTVGPNAKLETTGTIEKGWSGISAYPRLVAGPSGGIRAVFTGGNGVGGSPYNLGTVYSATASSAGTTWALVKGSMSQSGNVSADRHVGDHAEQRHTGGELAGRQWRRLPCGDRPEHASNQAGRDRGGVLGRGLCGRDNARPGDRRQRLGGLVHRVRRQRPGLLGGQDHADASGKDRGARFRESQPGQQPAVPVGGLRGRRQGRRVPGLLRPHREHRGARTSRCGRWARPRPPRCPAPPRRPRSTWGSPRRRAATCGCCGTTPARTRSTRSAPTPRRRRSARARPSPRRRAPGNWTGCRPRAARDRSTWSRWCCRTCPGPRRPTGTSSCCRSSR